MTRASVKKVRCVRIVRVLHLMPLEPVAMVMSKIQSLDELMRNQAQVAVEFSAQVFGVTLDYSEASIEQVEKILGKLYDSIPKETSDSIVKKSPTPQEILNKVSMAMGGYIGEVLKRQWGGKWKQNSPLKPDQKLLTLETVGIDVWPHMKVEKRLTNGPEDNVWFYFRALKDHIQKRYDMA
jgi:hypothetical protein